MKLPPVRHTLNITALFIYLLFLISSSCFADKPSQYFQLNSFGNYVNTVLHDEGMRDFEAITAEVENNIFWKVTTPP